MYYRLTLDFRQLENGTIALGAEQQHYLKKVLRLKTNDRFIALDGRGQSWLAEILDNRARLLEPIAGSNELPVPVTLMVAIPKNGFEDIVRGSTELGVTRIVPLLTRRGLVTPSAGKLDRWRKIATEAVEQSERQIVPTIEEPRPFLETLEIVENRSKPQTSSYICVTRKKVDSLVSRLPDRKPAEITLAIGPEGGWTDGEIDRAIAANFTAVSLGKRVLRTITAPLVALSLINAYLEG
ncbi:16S rRNA (uracil(1498)-N(3))-methyltransferase [Pannus brasiliensis]|uniref:16S rRNA (uracil(1498)-N(3))-methyltransferase n=1 Tax=Pannus brasiliensis TaxID=1579216 RepID=UPI003BEF2358